jgi:hypothetical protein
VAAASGVEGLTRRSPDARPGETEVVNQLPAAADVELAADVAAAVEDGTIAATLLKGLVDGKDQLLRALAIAAHGNDPE